MIANVRRLDVDVNIAFVPVFVGVGEWIYYGWGGLPLSRPGGDDVYLREAGYSTSTSLHCLSSFSLPSQSVTMERQNPRPHVSTIWSV